jgi:hypothetical protein
MWRRARDFVEGLGEGRRGQAQVDDVERGIELAGAAEGVGEVLISGGDTVAFFEGGTEEGDCVLEAAFAESLAATGGEDDGFARRGSVEGGGEGAGEGGEFGEGLPVGLDEREGGGRRAVVELNEAGRAGD